MKVRFADAADRFDNRTMKHYSVRSKPGDMSSETTPTDGTADRAVGSHELVVIGGGVAGLMAATFTARAGIETLVVNDGESVLNRNGHLENVPGFPAGVDPRLFGDMLKSQATRNGADFQSARVTDLDGSLAAGFVATAETDGASREIHADRVIVASFPDADFLDGFDIDVREAGNKQYVEEDHGRTGVEGLYVAGRAAERYHQAVISAGDGAETAITLIHDAEVPFYNDWVVPEGYFTDRGREVPPGCEEIDATEQAARQAESRAAMQEYFDEPHDAQQRTHPSLVDDEVGRIDFGE